MLKHDTDLVLSSLHQAHFVPRVVTLPNQFQSSRGRSAAVHGDAISEEFFLIMGQHALDLRQIGLGHVASR